MFFGRPASVIGSTTLRLDETLFWQALTTTSGQVDFWGTNGFTLSTGGKVGFFGDLISPTIPEFDPMIPSRSRGTFLQGPKPRVIMGSQLYEVEPSGLRFLQNASGFSAAGLRDGGFVTYGFRSGGYQFLRSLGVSPSSILAPSQQYYSGQLLLQGNGVTLGLMIGVADGGHLLQIDLDGGVSRRSVPFVNPTLLVERGPMVIVGRNSPMTLSNLTAGTPLQPPPGGFLYNLCGDTTLLFAATSNGLYVSEDDSTTWRLVEPGFGSSLTCGAGLAVGNPGDLMYVSDGGAVLRTRIPNSLSSPAIYVDPATGRIWLSSSFGATAYLR